MSGNTRTSFLVNAYEDPVFLRIVGKASYLNCTPVSEFFDEMIARGRTDFVVDFADCTGMDSTFLGILAAAAMDVKDKGSLVLMRLNQRNQELIENVGLHRILTVDTHGPDEEVEKRESYLDEIADDTKQAADSRLILKAHESLIEIDEGNAQKFQDVVSFLRGQNE